MKKKEILAVIIKAKGYCEDDDYYFTCEDCTVGKNSCRGCSDSNPYYNELIYNKAIKIYVKSYSESKLFELLL